LTYQPTALIVAAERPQNMSNDETAKQIGKAVMEYRDAKIECSRIEAKIDELFEAYRYAGEQMDPRRENEARCEPAVKDGKVIIGPERIKFDASAILSGAELVPVVSERDAARERLQTARKALDRLGMSDIG